MGGLLIVLVLAMFWHPQRSRTKTSTFADRESTDVVFRDDDRYWYGGVFYNNPDDPALFVPSRGIPVLSSRKRCRQRFASIEDDAVTHHVSDEGRVPFPQGT